MPLEVEYEKVSDNLERVYTIDVDDPENRRLVFEIKQKSKIVIFYPRETFFVSTILFEGFQRIPDEINEKGYFKTSGLNYYLSKKLEELNVNSFVISKIKDNSMRKYRNHHKIVLSYESFKKLRDNVAAINNEFKIERRQLIDDFFARIFPKKYKTSGISISNKTRRVIRNLDESIIEKLTQEDVHKIFNFIESLLKNKYKASLSRYKLFSAAKLKVDDIAIEEVLKEFDSLLRQDPPERKWGKFLQKNLYLLDSKYIGVISELNVVLASQRKVDFGLVDAQGFLDIFEIKKPTTPLLSSNKDRGNYYWSTEAVKAIAQAEKYLYNAETKSDILSRDIRREKNISVNVIRPRAFLVIGMSSQLDASDKQEDFRVLRRSLKNIEIILYDELIERLKNQQNKIYINESG